jgi:hypothetical protein
LSSDSLHRSSIASSPAVHQETMDFLSTSSEWKLGQSICVLSVKPQALFVSWAF